MSDSNMQAMMRSPAEFRRRVMIDADGTPRCYADVAAEWQLQDAAALDEAWQSIAGLRSDARYRRAWCERPRGSSKTTDLAIQAAWVLIFSRRPVLGIAAAADGDQARLLRDGIERLARLNPWASALDVQRDRITSKLPNGTELRVITSDAGSSYGLTPDFVILDEVVHWRSRDLFDSLLSAAAKKTRCVLLGITNAGFQPSWQWDVREAVREDPRWYFSRLESPAAWIGKAELDEQRRLLPDVAFRRLWLNEWTSGAGDALTAATIEAAVESKHRPMRGDEPGLSFMAGLDIGIKRDRSALVVVGKSTGHSERVPTGYGRVGESGERTPILESLWRPGDGKARLAYTRSWAPPAGGQVDLQAIENEACDVARRFDCPILFDPWQAQHLAQRLERRGVRMREVAFTGGNLQGMASATLEAFNGRAVVLYRDEELLADLRRLQVEERSFGFRLTSPRDGTGHGDLATAFQLALLGARDIGEMRDLGGWLDAGCF